jgi:acetyl esterase
MALIDSIAEPVLSSSSPAGSAVPVIAHDVHAVLALTAHATDGEPSVAELRAHHDRDALWLSGPGPDVASVRDLVIPGPHGPIPLRAYRARQAGTLPVVVYLHGGGWTVGSVDSSDGVGRALAVATGALVVSVDYRLAPEHPFPVPVDEAVAAVRFLAAHAGELGGDGGRLAIAGDSSGANLAAVAARRLRDEGEGATLSAQALVYPVCDVSLDTPSAHAFASGYGFTAAAMRRYWALYLHGAEGSDPDASPLQARDLSGLPPAFVATAEADVLRDEGEAYAAGLRAAGVRVALRRYPGTVHGFWRWLARSGAARRAVGEVGAALRFALNP